ncbi:MAG TPA: GTPase CgtA, partial [Bacteroides sp.]|nr:GTPase CgtA [Bacteroides sp.]
AASTEGRDPIEDINTINAELEAYNPDLLKRPQVIAANKTDVIYSDDENPVDRLKAEFEPKGIKVFPISAVSGKGVKELLYAVRDMLDSIDEEPTVFAREFFTEDILDNPDEPFTINRGDDASFIIEGPRIDRMLGYTNLDSERG